jgi:hypothetical protein
MYGSRTMRVSVFPWAARLRRALSAGLTRPILGAFALVLVVVTGMFALQLAGARQQHGEGESARHAEQKCGGRAQAVLVGRLGRLRLLRSGRRRVLPEQRAQACARALREDPPRPAHGPSGSHPGVHHPR